MAQTIKSFVCKAYREGASAEETWRAAQYAFPHKCCSWGYVVRLRKAIKEGDAVANAFSELVSEHRRQHGAC